MYIIAQCRKCDKKFAVEFDHMPSPVEMSKAAEYAMRAHGCFVIDSTGVSFKEIQFAAELAEDVELIVR